MAATPAGTLELSLLFFLAADERQALDYPRHVTHAYGEMSRLMCSLCGFNKDNGSQ